MPGIDKAWSDLEALPHDDVCRRACVRYDATQDAYIVPSLGMEFMLKLGSRTIEPTNPKWQATRERLGFFLDLTVLCHMVRAMEVPPTGRLLKPSSLKGGHHFFTGAHELPLGAIAQKYATDREGFLFRAREYGGDSIALGDAAVVLRPMPRLPMTLILWLADEEFPARADVLFDSSVELHGQIDISWSAAMLTTTVML